MDDANGAWQQLFDSESGASYYHNPNTGETSWEAPPSYAAATATFTATTASADLLAKIQRLAPTATKKALGEGNFTQLLYQEHEGLMREIELEHEHSPSDVLHEAAELLDNTHDPVQATPEPMEPIGQLGGVLDDVEVTALPKEVATLPTPSPPPPSPAHSKRRSIAAVDSRRHRRRMSQTHAWESGVYEEPSTGLARAHGESLKFMGGQADVLKTTVSEMGAMGVGIELYFRMSWCVAVLLHTRQLAPHHHARHRASIRYLGSLFAVMTALAVPALVLNFQGHGLTVSERDQGLGLAQFSLGNQGLHEENVPALGGCTADGGRVDCSGHTVLTLLTSSPAAVANWIAAADVLYSFAFLVFTVCVGWKIEDVTRHQDEMNITASDFTVLVRGFPAGTTEAQVRGGGWCGGG
jgi:hypothetical protein